MGNLTLRPYQIEAVAKVRQEGFRQYKRVCFCLPTGGGAEPFARLLCSGPPGDFDTVRWQKVTDAALIFCDQWAAKAHALGWKLDEVIGMDPIAPAARHDRRGLALLLERGARVVAIDSDGADVLTAQGSKQRFYRNVKASAEGAK
jgi:hypothetical protein